MTIGPGLPIDGQLNWGDPLNAEILADETQITANSTNVNNHIQNIPADPHGDRAYAANLVGGLISGINQPNGLVRLGPDGKIPLGEVPVGAGLTNWIDVIPDYGVPTNGVSDCAPSINAALFTTGVTNGGGILYIGNGTFNLGSPLIIYPNTWLLCSPGAIFQRSAPITAPFSMIQNFTSTILPAGSNVIIQGGQWKVNSRSEHGTMFTFANLGNVKIQDLTIFGNPDGHSPFGRLFGCTDVTIDNVQLVGAAPTGSRGSQLFPCFQVDELNVTNCPGLPNTGYAFQPCQDITVRHCKHRGVTLSDSFGPYTAWTSFCGSVGTILSGNIHSNIIVNGCFSTGLCNGAVEVINWSNLTCTGNFFTYPQQPYCGPGGAAVSWIGITAQIATFIFDVNSPRSYNCTPQSLPSAGICVNTSVETIIAQYTIPANDWLVGSTCYRHRHSGLIRTATNSEILTIKVYLGPLGTTSDTLVETIVVTFDTQVTDVPYVVHHRGFDIDRDGHWNPCGIEHISTALSTNIKVSISNTRCLPTAGVPLFITHTAKWTTGKTNNRHETRAGCHERCNL
jgi:hypothetical protein